MDLGLLFLLMGDRPVPLPASAAAVSMAPVMWWRGAMMPGVVPVGSIPAALRARWIAARGDLPDAARVAPLLATGQEGEAWLILDRRTAPVAAEPALDLLLADWTRRRYQGEGDCLVWRGTALEPDPIGAQAITDAEDLLAGLGRRWWAGPLIVVVGAAAMEGVDAARPLLPRAGAPIVHAATDGRAAFAGAAMRTALARMGTPWPPWFATGAALLAEARGGGRGLGIREGFGARREAGRAAIAQAFTSGVAAPPLAIALVAAMLRPGREAALRRFREGLLAGMPATESLERAGWSAAMLAAEP